MKFFFIIILWNTGEQPYPYLSIVSFDFFSVCYSRLCLPILGRSYKGTSQVLYPRNFILLLNFWAHLLILAEFVKLINRSFAFHYRKKNIFKLAQGEYIAPEKIENVYVKCKFIAQCFVYGKEMTSYTSMCVLLWSSLSLSSFILLWLADASFSFYRW